MFNWLSSLLVKNPQKPKNALATQPPHLEAVAVHNNHIFHEREEMAQSAEIYRQSSWVHVAVSRIAEAAALVPLRVMRLEGEKRVQVERHPLELLLDNPNPTMSRFELFEATLGYLELTGNAYWFLAGDALGRPAQIWPLRPERMSIVPHPTNYVAGYIYEVDGLRIPLEPIEVIHFKRWHPANDYYGLSAIEAARLTIDTDKAMARWNKNTFGQDNGVPAGIVNIKDFVNEADYERIKREWRSSYGGGQRKTAFLRGGTVEWQEIGLSHTELDFLKGRLAHRDEILNIFGIPVGLVSENATEANARVAERLFIERTLWPKLVRLAQRISQELLPFYAGDYIAEFEDIRPSDTQARLDEIRAAQSILSINEIRERYYQLPAVAWGDFPASMNQNPPTVGERLRPAPSDENKTESPESDEALPTKAVLDELAQWERYALKRLGKAEFRPFKVINLPDELAFELSAGLLAAEDKESIKALFASAKEQLKPLPENSIPSDEALTPLSLRSGG
jgi:HK97 family phage portal protein